MAEDLPPSPFIKKRPKGSIRPSGSTSSLRSLAASPGGSNLSFAQDDGVDDDGGNVAVIRARGKKTPAGRVKDREGVAKKSGRLSFGGGDEEEESDTSFVVKRTDSPSSTGPRRLLRPSGSTASLRASDLPASLEQATISPARSLYSKEHLNELKAGTLSTPPPSHSNDYDDLTRSKFGSQIDDMPDSIPTTAAIAEAKKRRERMRAEGGGTGSDGFVSLEVGFASKSGESRLVREDDEIGDGDEDMAEFTGAQETVPLGKKANKEAAEKMRSGMIDMIQDVEEDEEDEESKQWEEAQIKRGEQRRPGSLKTSSKRPYKPTPIPHTSTLHTLSGVSTRLTTALSNLESSHTLDAATLTHFSRERAELDAQEQELRTEVQKAEAKNRWFSDFKLFIEEVAAFLDEKYPLLERIEKENLAIQKERYDIVSRRRFEDDSDDVALFTGAAVPSSYRPPLAEGEEPPVSTEPEVDEFGRAREDDLAARSAVRVARRSARERRAAARTAAAAGQEEEDAGAWTDDELSSGDAGDLADALKSLRESLASVFADVKADDFRDPNLGIRRKFEEWREKFGDEYRNAFGGLAMVGVWEFWARVEMALWNPFEIDLLAKTPAGLDAYQWHSSLSSFGHSARATSHSSDGEDEQDESEEVVNALVTSVVIPRLEKLAKETYDPLSRRQTTRALGLVDEVSYCVEKSSPKFESLVVAFVSRLQLAITQAQSLIAPHLAAISLPSNSFDPSTFTSRSQFLHRQVKLLQNAVRWRRFARSLRLSAISELAGAGLLFDELLQRELVAKIILPIAEASWGTGGEEVAAKVLSVLPGEVPPALQRRLEGKQ